MKLSCYSGFCINKNLHWINFRRQRAVPCFSLPNEARKNKLKKPPSPTTTTAESHTQNFVERDLITSPFRWPPLAECCWDTHLQIRLWFLNWKSSWDFSLPLTSTGFAEVVTPNLCYSISSSQGNCRTDVNVSAPFVAQAWFSVSWRRLKIWGTVQILSTTLQSSEILKPKLIQCQAVSIGGPCLI